MSLDHPVETSHTYFSCISTRVVKGGDPDPGLAHVAAAAMGRTLVASRRIGGRNPAARATERRYIVLGAAGERWVRFEGRGADCYRRLVAETTKD